MSVLRVGQTESGFFAVFRGEVDRVSDTFICFQRAQHELTIIAKQDANATRTELQEQD